jgi:hypothetical protein
LRCLSVVVLRFGTLLGPEETPACRVFLVPLLVLSSNASFVVGVVAVVGWGVVVC